MKILKLHLRNINSLQGEHTFDFEDICAGGNLFAITGATGSGKSSILDALTLALYGRTPRYGTKSSADVMSRHTGECLAEVTFEAHAKRYRSKWSLHRARSRPEGKLQTPHMEVAHALDGEIIESGVNKTPNVVRELCGLDFDQFRRSVLLAQGEFAAFLRADSNERSKLLERITGTDIYKEISKFAYQKAAGVRLEWQQMKDRLADINLLDAEEIEQLQSRNDAITGLITELENKRKELSQKVQLRANLEQTQAQLQELKNKKQELAERQSASAEQFKALERHETSLRFAPESSQFDALKRSATELESEIQSLTSKQQAEQARQTELERKVIESAAQRTEHNNKLQKLHELLPQVRTLDRQIETTSKEMDAARLVHEVAGETLEIREKALAQSCSDRDNLEQSAQQTHSWLENNSIDAELSETISAIVAKVETWRSAQSLANDQSEMHKTIITELGSLDLERGQHQRSLAVDQRELEHVMAQLANNDLQQIEVRQAELQQRDQVLNASMELLRELTRLQEHHALNITELDEQITAAQALQAELNGTTAALEKLETERSAAAENLRLHLEILNRARKIQQLEAERDKLIAGEPCPLCGSKEHPLVQEYQEANASSEEDAHQKSAEQLRKIEAQITEARSGFEFKKQRQQELADVQKSIAQRIQQLGQQYAELLPEDNNFTRGIRIEDSKQGRAVLVHVKEEHADAKRALQECREQLEQSHKLRSNAESLQSRISNHRTALELLERQAQTLKEKRQALAAQEEHRREDLRLRSDAAREILRKFLPPEVLINPPSDREMQALQQRISLYRENQREFERLQRDHQAAIKTAAMQLERKDEAAKALAQEENNVSTLTKLLGELQNQRRAIFGSDDADKRLQELQTTLDASSSLHQQAEQSLLALNTSLQKTQTTLDIHTGRLQEIHRDISRHGDTLRAALRQAGFASIEDQRQAILSSQKAAELKEHKEMLSSAIEQNETLSRDKQLALEQLEATAPASEEAAALGEQLAAVNAELDDLKQETGGIAEKLRHNAEQDRQSGQLQILLSDKQKDKARWELLNELIGSSSGQTFSRYAQSLTLQRLVALANRHVIKLNDRYRIRKQPSDEAKAGAELELEIVDRHQADTVRPMQSLSGGESFLISLGLALGLAELAGRNNRIDSLFIDEGFGSLDSTTLESALNVLETLQAQGKTIGVISHVEALKERIAIQIQVHKLSGGISTTEVVSRLGVSSIPLNT